MDVEFSEEACDTMKQLMPLSASAVKIRRLTPMTPTMESPVTVMRVVPLMLEMPLMGLSSLAIFAFMMVPLASGLNVFLTRMGMFFTQTG